MSIARLHRRDTVERSGALFFSEAAIWAVAHPTENAGVADFGNSRRPESRLLRGCRIGSSLALGPLAVTLAKNS